METLSKLLAGEGGLLRVRALLAFAFAATTCYLFIDGQTPPGELLALTGGAVGYYFGTRGAA